MHTPIQTMPSRILWALVLLMGYPALAADPPEPTGAKSPEELLRPRPHRDQILSIAFSKDGKRLLTVGREGTARLWEAATGKEITVFSASGPGILALNGRAFVVPTTSDRGQVLCVLDPITGKEQRRLELPASKVLCAAFAPDATFLATSHDNGHIHLWELATGKRVRSLQFPNWNRTNALAWSPNGRLLALTRTELNVRRGGHDDWIFLWNPLREKHLQTLHGPSDTLGPLTFSHDGKSLASSNGGRDAALRIHEVSSGGEVIRFPYRGNHPTLAAFSPDGILLASWTYQEQERNAIVRIRETTEWKELAALHVPPADITCLTFSPDGSRLAVGKVDGSVPIWDVAQLRLLAGPRLRQLGTEKLRELWEELADRKAPTGQSAINTLVAGGGDSVAFLAKHIQPAPMVDPKWIVEQIDQLDSNDPNVRQKAFTALEQIADDAEPAMIAALSRSTISVEVRKRLEELLAVPGSTRSPETLRRIRAVQILDRIGSEAAREVLRKLAEGNPKAIETLDAKQALDRFASWNGRE